MNQTALKDLFIFPSGITHLYLLHHEGKYLLVDAGMKKKVKAFFSLLLDRKISPEQITHVVLTHTHYDHTGGLPLIRELTHARVVVHAAEADHLRQGYTPAPYGTRFSTRVISFLGRKVFPGYSRYDPVEPDVVWEGDSFQPGGFPAEIIHTPGHTDGSASLIWKGELAFVGDTLFGYEKDDCLPWFANDLDELARSWQRLLDTGCRVFYPAHGRPVRRELLEKAYRQHFGR